MGNPAAWPGTAGPARKAQIRAWMHHAWLVENLDGRRVRILTQETQKGKPAEELHNAKPNPMINGHQDWLDSLVEAARKAKQA